MRIFEEVEDRIVENCPFSRIPPEAGKYFHVPTKRPLRSSHSVEKIQFDVPISRLNLLNLRQQRYIHNSCSCVREKWFENTRHDHALSIRINRDRCTDGLFTIYKYYVSNIVTRKSKKWEQSYVFFSFYFFFFLRYYERISLLPYKFTFVRNILHVTEAFKLFKVL